MTFGYLHVLNVIETRPQRANICNHPVVGRQGPSTWVLDLICDGSHDERFSTDL